MSNVAPEGTLSFEEAVMARRSVRGFLDTPVPAETLRTIFTLAQQAPSNCNIQHWKVMVASGQAAKRLSQKFIDVVLSGKGPEPDFDRLEKFEGIFRTRQVETAQALYGAMGIERDDKEGRMRAALRNFEFFNAPHVALLAMPKDFGEVLALDVGMYAQTLMLAMAAHGVGSCAQASLSNYPSVIRDFFGLDDHYGLLMGISFGYEDPSIPANKTRVPRTSIDAAVQFIDD
ncbi:MAG: nitroreductase [Gammaproteobacteria bacterium]|nr:nitroreductase [Gammaproteobacteria bacterium]